LKRKSFRGKTIKTISNNYIYLSIIFVLVLLSFLAADNFEYWENQYSGMDQTYYREMSEASPNISMVIPHFFAYRIFPPWLAGILPGDVSTGYKILNFIFLLGISYSFYFLLREIALKEITSILMTLAFIFNRYFFQIHTWNYFQLTDLVSNTIIFLSIISIKKKRFLATGILFFLGMMSKETVLVIIPVGFAFLFQTIQGRKTLLHFAISLIPGLILFAALRIFIPAAGEEKLAVQVMDESYKYLSLFVWAKVLVVPFIPFSITPLIFYKEFMNFIRQHFYLFVLFSLVVFTAILGYDFERLLAPASPFLFAFVGIIIEKYQLVKTKRWQLTIIFLMVILNSFYHIAGIVRLPNSTLSLIVSTCSLLISTALFINIRVKSNLD